MKTGQLIELLARGAGPAPRALAARRLVPAAGLGVLFSSVLALGAMGPVGVEMLTAQAFWMKLGYAAALAAASGWLAARLSRPAARTEPAWRSVAAVAIAVTLVGIAALWQAPDMRRDLLGQTWAICPPLVFALSLPGLAVAIYALRGMAPTRPVAAGFAAGLLAGASSAFGYALHCPETGLAFVAVWYSVGILSTGAFGALLGPRVLRW